MTRAERLLAQLEIHLANALDTLNALRIERHNERMTERSGTSAPDVKQER